MNTLQGYYNEWQEASREGNTFYDFDPQLQVYLRRDGYTGDLSAWLGQQLADLAKVDVHAATAIFEHLSDTMKRSLSKIVREAFCEGDAKNALLAVIQGISYERGFNELTVLYKTWQDIGQPSGAPFTEWLIDRLKSDKVTIPAVDWVASRLEALADKNPALGHKILYALAYPFRFDVECRLPMNVYARIISVHKGEKSTCRCPAGPTSPRAILDEASRLINGDRARDYGDAKESFMQIADLWSAYLKSSVSPQDVAVMMMLLKLARLKNSNYTHYDSLADCLGYGALIERIAELKKA